MCVWPQRRLGSLGTGAGGPMGVLGISGSVGRRVLHLYVLVVVDALVVSESVLMVQGTYSRSRWWCWWSYGRTECMSGMAMFAFLDVLFNLVTG